MAMESPDCAEKHPPLKSEHEELNESVLQELVKFIRETVGDNLADRGHRYTAPDDDEHNYWVYIVEVILGTDKNDVAVCVEPCNVDEPDEDPPQEDENERANRQAEELLREEEARNASQQKISSSKTLKKKKKKAKQKAKQGKESKPDEVDEDKVGKGDRYEEEKVNDVEKDEGYEGKKVNVDEEERAVGYKGERDESYDAGRVNNKKEEKDEGYKGEKVEVDEEERAIGCKVEEVHVDEEKRAVGYKGVRVDGYGEVRVHVDEEKKAAGYEKERDEGYEEEKAVGYEKERAVRYQKEKVNVDEKKRAHRYKGEKAVGYQEEKVNVDEEKRVNGYRGEKGNGYEGEKYEEKRANGYEGEKGNGYEGEKGEEKKTNGYGGGKSEEKRVNGYDGEKGEEKRANGYGGGKGNGYVGEKGKEYRADSYEEGRVVADSRLQNVVPATVGIENMEIDNSSRTRLKFDKTHVSNLPNFHEEAGDDAYMLLYKKGGGEQYKEKESCSVNGRQKDSNEEMESSLSEFTADERDKYLSQNRAEENGQVAFIGDGRDLYSNNNRMPGENVDGFQDTETAKQTEEVRQSEENAVSGENVNIAQHKETIGQTEELTQTIEGIFSNENVSEAQDTETVRQIEETEQAPGNIIWRVKIPEALGTESVKQTQEPKLARNVDEVQDKKMVEKSIRLKQPGASANSGPVGIRNLGSTCYMNAVFQFLLRPMGDKWLDLDKQETAATDTDTDLIKEFHLLWELLLSNNGGFTIEPESTEGIQSAWNQFKHPNSPTFEPTQQEDAEEFMEFIFTHLLNGRLCINAFQVRYFKVSCCRMCRNTDVIQSHQYPSLRLGLRENGRGAFDLTELLINKFQNSVCTEYFCGRCCGNYMGNYNRFIFTAEFLIIWLPRTTRLTEVGNWKRQYKLRNIPRDLDLNPYFTHGKNIPEDFTRYKLHAVLTHFGQSMDSGHYIVAVLDTTSGTWFKFDDDRVTKLVDFQREVGDDAYMLLYRNLAQGEQIKGQESDSEERGEQIKGKEMGSAEMVMNGRVKPSKEIKGEAQNAGKKDYREEYVHRSQNTNSAGVQEFAFFVGEQKISIPIKNISESQDTNKIGGTEAIKQARNETISPSEKSKSRSKKNGDRSRKHHSSKG